MTTPSPSQWLQCIRCGARYPVDQVRYTCSCDGLLAVERDAAVWGGLSTRTWDARLGARSGLDRSGVWRFREALLDVDARHVVSLPEGNTRLYSHPRLTAYAGVASLVFKHEGDNPTGSFKDRGMTLAMTAANMLGATRVACASTGNTSASLAAYAAYAGKTAVVFVPSGKISMSKLAQTLAYGARVLQVRGDFDAAMALVRQACDALGIYLVNSVNPFRIEGQKAIGWELLQDLSWNPPDWISLPAGNLGNTAALGKALHEALTAGWIPRLPQVLSVQARGANPFARSFATGFATREKVTAQTVASAIRIGDPVSFDKARTVIEQTRGQVLDASDDEILAAKRVLDHAGIGCEPASAASLAGLRLAVERGLVPRTARVACILTGHVLKDPDAVMLPVPGEPNAQDQIVEVDATLDAVRRALAG